MNLHTRSRTHYLPGLCLRLEGSRDSLVERLGRALDSALASQPVGELPAATVRLGCAPCDAQPLAPAGDGIPLEHGYRLWRSGDRWLIGNGFASIELRAEGTSLRLACRSRGTAAFRHPERVDYLAQVLLGILFPRLGYHALDASMAFGGSRRVLLLGPAESRARLAELLGRAGWITSDREPVFLRRGEGGIFAVTASSRLPVVFPRELVLVEAPPAPAREARVMARPRNPRGQLVGAALSCRFPLDPVLRRERDRVLVELAAQTRALRLPPGSSAEWAAAALRRLGITTWSGADIAPPRTIRLRARPSASGAGAGVSS